MNNKKFFPIIITMAFACGYFLICIFRSVNAVQAPYLVSSLHLSAGSLGVLTSSYLLAFAIAQLPLGVLLDRFGIRIVQTLLFSLAGIGTLLFAQGQNTTTLTIARFIIGLGASGGAMAAFKANAIWFPKKLPLMNGLILAIGGLGALTATKPTQIFIEHFGWRQFNIYLAGFAFLTALFILLTVPKKTVRANDYSPLQQIKDYALIYKDPFFWRITPITVIPLGFFMAVQGLWAGPWLQQVNNMSISDMSLCLLGVAIAFTIGSALIGLIANIAIKHNHSLTKIITICTVLFILVQTAILLRIDFNPYISWFLYAFFVRVGSLSFTEISLHFPTEYSGRSITALNVLIFVSAFSIQFLMGWIIHFWQLLFTTSSLILGYQIAFGVFIALEIMALVWFILPSNKLIGDIRTS